jgi:AmiR/NasT family two-component response regulator
MAAVRGAQAEDHLWQAVHSRQLIGEAVGILAHEHRVTTVAAFANLTVTSQQTNVKVRELAARIVADYDTAQVTGTPPVPPRTSTERPG